MTRSGELPFEPFGRLVAEQCALRAAGDEAGYSILARQTGFDESQMRRWARGTYHERTRNGPRAGELVEKRFEKISWANVDRITTALGIRVEELYPELDIELEPDAWCATCGEEVTPVRGICPWCEARVAGASAPDVKTTLRERPARRGPGTGRQTKLTEPLVRAAMAAYATDPVYLHAARAVAERMEHPYPDERQFSSALRHHFQRRGWWTPDDVLRALDGDVMSRPVPYRGSLSPEVLAEARRLYEDEGLGFRRIARRLLDQTSAKSEASLTNSLYHAFKVHGWPTRDRVEATRLASWKHGRKTREGHDEGSYRRWYKETRGLYRPTCRGTLTGGQDPAHAGRPCSKPAMRGSEYCSQHDPDRAERAGRQLARMRATAAANRGGMLPAAPLGWWLDNLCAEHGAKAVIERMPVGKDRIWQLRRGKVQRISRRRAQEMLDAWGAGEQVADLWPLIVIDGERTAEDREPIAA